MIVDSAHYKDGVRQHDEALTPEHAAELRAAAGPGEFVWVGIHEPEPGDLQRLQKLFGLHELAIEDAQNPHQRPKIEDYDEDVTDEEDEDVADEEDEDEVEEPEPEPTPRRSRRLRSVSAPAEKPARRAPAAQRSATIIAGAAVLPALMFGTADMSQSRRLSMPRTRRRASSTAIGSPSAPIRAVEAGW